MKAEFIVGASMMAMVFGGIIGAHWLFDDLPLNRSIPSSVELRQALDEAVPGHVRVPVYLPEKSVEEWQRGGTTITIEIPAL